MNIDEKGLKIREAGSIEGVVSSAWTQSLIEWNNE